MKLYCFTFVTYSILASSSAFIISTGKGRSINCKHRNILYQSIFPTDEDGFDEKKIPDNDEKEDEGTHMDFMASLNKRISEVKDRDTKKALVVLDAMLPRQVLKIQVKNALLTELIRTQLYERQDPTFGMLGMAMLRSGQKINLTTGVEVEILNGEFVDDDSVSLVLRGERRFKIVDEVENTEQGWTEARVEYLDSEAQEAEELQGDDKLALARAIMKARELSSPNASVKNNLSLIDRWIELARERERELGQIDQLLEDLGNVPGEDEPTERALWVGALINPLPAMGVATEIRPALLTAETAEEKVNIAFDGILKSIRHMDGTQPMW